MIGIQLDFKLVFTLIESEVLLNVSSARTFDPLERPSACPCYPQTPHFLANGERVGFPGRV